MEWFGEKMLPKGLTKLAYEIVPGWVSPRLKIITLPKKEYKYVSGTSDYYNGNYIIKIYPTVILADVFSGIGVTSFRNWVAFLRLFLHELGHITTYDKRKHISKKEYYENIESHQYIESLANQWRDIILNKISSRDSRLGQPIGWIGGLPGIYLMRSHDIAKEDRYCPYEMDRINNYRAYRCNGQVKLSELVNKLWNEYSTSGDYDRYGELIKGNKIKRIVKKISSDLGINRFYIDKAGRKHMFFNHLEADTVLNEARNRLEIERAKILKKLLIQEINNLSEIISDNKTFA